MNQKYILSRLPNIAFLCGGNNPESIRSKFIEYVKTKYKHVFISGEAGKNIFSNERIIIAEKAEHLWQKCLKEENAGYDNLLDFETDIAELASVIPVFLESPGSILETGSFFSKQSLREKLLIIVEKKRFNNDSFIDKAILQNLSKHERVIYYDNQSHNLEKIFEKIFNFRNQLGHQIRTSESFPNSLIFFLLQILCEWKTKKEIIKELDKRQELKTYKEGISNQWAFKDINSFGFYN